VLDVLAEPVDYSTGIDTRGPQNGVFDWIDWSPDGTMMAGIVYARDQRSRIVTLQVPENENRSNNTSR
jgi:hypothetical protein